MLKVTRKNSCVKNNEGSCLCKQGVSETIDFTYNVNVFFAGYGETVFGDGYYTSGCQFTLP